MKKKWIITVVAILVFAMSLFGCGGGESGSGTDDGEKADAQEQEAEETEEEEEETPQEEPEEEEAEYVEESQFFKVFTNPSLFKGKRIKIMGRVFTTPEHDADGIYLQVWANPKYSEWNTVVMCKDTSLNVDTDDYVIIDGVVKDVFKGQNMMGGDVKAPLVVCDTLEVSDYMTVVAPAIETKQVDQTIDQSGYQITVEKVEFAESETRLYLKVKNDGDEVFNVYSFNALIIQGSTQYEEEDNWEADYPEIQSEIRPGVETEGIVSYKAMDPKEPLKVIIEAYTDDWDIELEDYEFEIE